ncbi:release factor glutamine methyltransferase [Sphingobacterium yanglingense]|uniref:Release factor glutamine methyltransferase n=2 Tax=Sphingobacterium yanglingense TaxID=1437280 RepID=A0A4R6W557_9SPHI|nr:release factor glutamine methyltransferase [Sphingobacterium yanglingense]
MYVCRMNNTWQEIAELFQKELKELYPSAEINELFSLTVEHLCGKRSNQLHLIKHEQPTPKASAETEHILAQLKTGRPIQHVLGYAHFYGHIFEVSEHTLIPRPETEELVHLIRQDSKSKQALNCIDIGTGTGCIPISLAKCMPQHQYWAIDISKEALEVAKRNAQKNEVDIQFIQMDILEWDLAFASDLKFDIIVSNPPYITTLEKADMHQNVLAFEPHSALFVEDSAPLLFYDYIGDFAKEHLTPEGHLYFEINQYLADETAELLSKKGFNNVQIFNDINGAKRMIRANAPS